MFSAAQLVRPVGPLTGVGLFTGLPGSITIHPARDAGFVFRRVDTARKADIRATVQQVTSDTSWSGLPPGVPVRNTTLAVSPRSARTEDVVATVEHVLSALAGLRVRGAVIEVEGPEVPILDGSALGLVEAMLPALAADPSPPLPLVIRKEVTVTDKSGAFIRATPGAGCVMTYTLDYGEGSPLPRHEASWDGSAERYAPQIASARTFSLVHEAKAAQAMGLFGHLTPKEMLVIGNDGLPVDNTYRFAGEPAHHKLLDLIGDLALLGRPIEGHIAAYRSGHALAHELARAILAGL